MTKITAVSARNEEIDMLKYSLKRLGYMAVVLVILSVIMYMMFGLSWAAAIAGKAARPIINDLFISNQFSVPPR